MHAVSRTQRERDLASARPSRLTAGGDGGIDEIALLLW